MFPAVLDTDLLSEILKGKNPLVVQRGGAYLAAHQQFAFSAITLYEVTRGLKAKRASKQLGQFQQFCTHALVLPITDTVLEHAADLWMLGDAGGHPKNDADLIIAATALLHGRVLVTANTSHYAWIPGLTLENWRQP